MSKDKEYIVNTKINTELTADEKRKLKQKSKPVTPAIDRRNPLASKKPVSPERRKNKK